MRVSTDKDGWEVTLDEAGFSLRAQLCNETWVVTEPGKDGSDVVPNACFGGWLDEDTLRFDMIFLETPHRLSVTCACLPVLSMRNGSRRRYTHLDCATCARQRCQAALRSRPRSEPHW